MKHIRTYPAEDFTSADAWTLNDLISSLPKDSALRGFLTGLEKMIREGQTVVMYSLDES